MPKATGGEHGGKRRIDGTRLEPANVQSTYADLGLGLGSRAGPRKSSPGEDLSFLSDHPQHGFLWHWYLCGTGGSLSNAVEQFQMRPLCRVPSRGCKTSSDMEPVFTSTRHPRRFVTLVDSASRPMWDTPAGENRARAVPSRCFEQILAPSLASRQGAESCRFSAIEKTRRTRFTGVGNPDLIVATSACEQLTRSFRTAFTDRCCSAVFILCAAVPGRAHTAVAVSGPYPRTRRLDCGGARKALHRRRIAPASRVHHTGRGDFTVVLSA